MKLNAKMQSWSNHLISIHFCCKINGSHYLYFSKKTHIILHKYTYTQNRDQERERERNNIIGQGLKAWLLGVGQVLKRKPSMAQKRKFPLTLTSFWLKRELENDWPSTYWEDELHATSLKWSIFFPFHFFNQK